MPNDTVRRTPEWNALNNIWKVCSQEQRQSLEADFMLLTEFVRSTTLPRFTAPVAEQHRYLYGLSDGAQSFIMDILNQGEPNLYHSIMSVMDGKTAQGKDAIQKYYYDTYACKRPYIRENWSLVCEIFDFCWKKHVHKTNKRTNK